ncbi:MAG TPA: hypothetical protein VK796_06745, partial [Cytophaga sp.]|nr:hypothetical protein [Cytophaga sp.]
SMCYFLNAYPDSIDRYKNCLEYLRIAFYSMRDLNRILLRNANKDFIDSTTMIPIDKKVSIKIVVADAIAWESSYQRYAGKTGSEQYILLLQHSYWKSWEEIHANVIKQ